MQTKSRKPETRGGAREGAGRKALSPSEPTAVFPVRMTPSQRDKLYLLGGAAWVREQIDAAPNP